MNPLTYIRDRLKATPEEKCRSKKRVHRVLSRRNIQLITATNLVKPASLLQADAAASAKHLYPKTLSAKTRSGGTHLEYPTSKQAREAAWRWGKKPKPPTGAHGTEKEPRSAERS